MRCILDPAGNPLDAQPNARRRRLPRAKRFSSSTARKKPPAVCRCQPLYVLRNVASATLNGPTRTAIPSHFPASSTQPSTATIHNSESVAGNVHLLSEAAGFSSPIQIRLFAQTTSSAIPREFDHQRRGRESAAVAGPLNVNAVSRDRAPDRAARLLPERRLKTSFAVINLAPASGYPTVYGTEYGHVTRPNSNFSCADQFQLCLARHRIAGPERRRMRSPAPPPTVSHLGDHRPTTRPVTQNTTRHDSGKYGRMSVQARPTSVSRPETTCGEYAAVR